MANGISPTTANANSVNWNNPEFTGLTPNTNYIVEVQTTIPAGCAIYAQNLTYYQIPAVVAAGTCSTCATATCTPLSASGASSSAAHAALSAIGTNPLTPAASYGNVLNPGQSQTVCLPVTVTAGSQTLGASVYINQTVSPCATAATVPVTCTLQPANCGSAIAASRTNANGVGSGFNPEWDGLAAGNYILCVTVNVLNTSTCNTIQIANVGYYNVIPGAPPATTVTCPTNMAFNKLNWPDAPTFPKFPTTGFNCKTPLDSIFQSPETVFDSGYVQGFPGFIMYMTGYSSNTSVTLTVNGTVYDYSGPAANFPGGNVINWGAFTGESIEWYLPAGASCSLNICDNTQPGMPYQIYDYTTGQMITQGTACSTTNCTPVNFTIGSPTMSWTLDGGTTGILDMHNGGAQLTSPGTLTPGTHTIIYTYSNNAGCSFTNKEIITVAGPKIAVTSPVNPPCGSATGGFTMAGSGSTGPYTYSIDNGSTYTSTTKPTTLVAGTYTVSTKDKNGCVSATTTVTLTGNGAPTTTPITPATIALDCKTATGTFTEASTSGYTYAWGGPGVTAGGATNIATVNAAGTYTVTVTNGSCSSTLTATATLNNTKPTMGTVPTLALSCATTSGSLTENATTTGAAAFAWAGAGFVGATTNSSVTVNAAGTYTVTVTDAANNCTNTTTATVTLNNTKPTPGAVSPLVLTCNTLSGSLTETATTVGAATYAWAGAGVTAGAATATATVNAAGTYTVTVTDAANSCTNTTTATVTLNNTKPTISSVAAAPVLNCIRNADTLKVTASAGGGAQYSWTGPSISSGGTTYTPIVGGAGAYTLTVTDAVNGCTTTSSVTVTTNTTAPTLATISPQTITCANKSAQVTASPTAITGTPSYSWSGTSITSGANTSTITVGAVTGTYTVTITDGANGCTNTTTASVTLNGTPPTLAAVAPANLTCTVTTATLMESPTDSVGKLSYTWSGPAGGITGVATNHSIVINAPGTYSVSVTDISNNCSAATTVTVSQTPNNLALDTVSTPANCSNVAGSATVNVTAGTPSAYTWSGAASTFTTATANNIGAGTYTVTVSDNNGCTKTAAVKVSQVPVAFSLAAAPVKATCAKKGSVAVNIVGTAATPVYSWSSGVTTTSDTGLVAGTAFSVTVTDQTTTCAVALSGTIGADTLPPNPLISPSQTIIIGSSVTLQAGGGVSYLWSNNLTTNSIVVTPPLDTVYCVKVTGANNCSAKACTQIIVEVPCDGYFMPTAFSPNGDGENDILMVRCDPTCVVKMRLAIFDRWGEEVAEITNPTKGWDGSFRAKALDPGVYMYYLTISFTDGKNIAKTGNVTLVR